MPIKRDIIYAIFLKTIQYTEDNFWKDTFENLSYGICPNGSFISKGFICSNIKGKEFVYKFIDKEPEIIYDDIYRLLKEKLNIMSRNERSILLKEFEEVENNIKKINSCSWNEIKKKGTKDILIQNFLIKMKSDFELKNVQIKKLYNLINLCLIIKSITNQDIEYIDGEIKNIKGITFYKNKYKVDIDIYKNIDN
jgi:hypothetical protein